MSLKRKYKFRAWHRAAGVMVPSTVMDHLFNGKRAVIPYRFDIARIENHGAVLETDTIYGSPFMNEDLAVMQYTGLYDKDGSEICEGDIVLWDEHYDGDRRNVPGKGYVIFQEGSFEIKPIVAAIWCDDLSVLSINKELKIIGNIYNNPQLL